MSYVMDAPLSDTTNRSSEPLIAPAAAVAQGVVSLTLVNADTGAAIPGYDPLPIGQTFTMNLATLPTRRLNIRANLGTGLIGSVRFSYDSNVNFNTEKTAPYALAGDTVSTDGKYRVWTPTVGTHTLTAAAFTTSTATGSIGGPLAITFNVTDQVPTPTSTQTPYSGTAISVPGLIQAENFDNGGEGVAYHDTTSANLDGAYRNSGVDAGVGIGSDGAYVGHIVSGEWLEYSINTPTAGTFGLDLRASTAKAGGTVKVEVDGVDKTGTITLPNTGGYDHWQLFSKSGISVSAGNHVVRVSFASKNTGGIANLDWLKFTSASSTPTPTPTPTPTATPWPTKFTSATSSPVARFEATYHVFDGKIYVFGGFKDSSFHVTQRVDVYDPAADQWTKLNDLPAGMAQTHLAAANDGRYIYFAGGFAGDLMATKTPSQIASDKVFRYDPQNDAWLQMTSLPFARGAGGLAIIGRTLHYFGGNPVDRETDLADHITFNLDGGTGTKWVSAPGMLNPRDHFSALTLDGKIYAIGGVHGHDILFEQTREIDVFDPATNAWTKLADMPISKSHMEGQTFVSDGKIIVAGGQINNPDSTSNVIAYDPATNTWQTLASLPQARQGGVVARIGNKIVITLGAAVTNAPQSDTLVGLLL